jgi:hypothetical protein
MGQERWVASVRDDDGELEAYGGKRRGRRIDENGRGLGTEGGVLSGPRPAQGQYFGRRCAMRVGVGRVASSAGGGSNGQTRGLGRWAKDLRRGAAARRARWADERGTCRNSERDRPRAGRGRRWPPRAKRAPGRSVPEGANGLVETRDEVRATVAAVDGGPSMIATLGRRRCSIGSGQLACVGYMLVTAAPW